MEVVAVSELIYHLGRALAPLRRSAQAQICGRRKESLEQNHLRKTDLLSKRASQKK